MDQDEIEYNDLGYVGLKNPFRTCYLNSLLQTLYMTPELRNELYRWEYNGGADGLSQHIPFQLQRLFFGLNTERVKAIETDMLTRSFGWTEVQKYVQHDVQELMRVLFEAMRKTWKLTDHRHIIRDLFEGKMKSYVKCLKCNHESAKDDTFMDLSLTVKPFGSDQAYGSVEESLKAFIEPETLDGENQYLCDKCHEKTDAHKGIKFTKFPYILCLQLNRFEYDVQKRRRTKLTDKMTFPRTLEAYKFMSRDENRSRYSSNDDYSHTSYELYSIQVHSGTADFGHYYAYIKLLDREDNMWLCFNDEEVRYLYERDIDLAFGGPKTVTQAKGMYSKQPETKSSNAYMLVYRQVNKEKNQKFMLKDEFPRHLSDNEGYKRRNKRDKALKYDTYKIKAFCHHPEYNKRMEQTLEIHKEKTLAEATKIAWLMFDLEDFVKLNCVRLVKWESKHCDQSFEGKDQKPVRELWGWINDDYSFDLMLETKRPEQHWEVYDPKDVSLNIYEVDLANEKVTPRGETRVNGDKLVSDVKEHFADKYKLPAEHMRMVIWRKDEDYFYFQPINRPTRKLTMMMRWDVKSEYLFIESSGIDNRVEFFEQSKLFKLLSRYHHTIKLYITIPDEQKNPSYEPSAKRAKETAMEVTPSAPEDKVPDVASSAPEDKEAEVTPADPEDKEMEVTPAAPEEPKEELSPTFEAHGEIFERWGHHNHTIKDTTPDAERFFEFNFEKDYEAKKRLLVCSVDNRMTLKRLKLHIEPHIGVREPDFRLFCKKEWSEILKQPRDREVIRWEETLKDEDIVNETKMEVVLGRCLRPGQHYSRCYEFTPRVPHEQFKKNYQHEYECEYMKLILEKVFVASDTPVTDTKKEIIRQLNEKDEPRYKDIPMENLRLRTKNWTVPGDILTHDMAWGDNLYLSMHTQLYVEIFDKPDPKKTKEQKQVYFRRWHPSTLEMDEWVEVLLEKADPELITDKMAEMSDIPREHLVWGRARYTFPADFKAPELEENVEFDSDWSQGSADGCVLFYKDKREELKKLNDNEKEKFIEKQTRRSFQIPHNPPPKLTFFRPADPAGISFFN